MSGYVDEGLRLTSAMADVLIEHAACPQPVDTASPRHRTVQVLLRRQLLALHGGGRYSELTAAGRRAAATMLASRAEVLIGDSVP